MPAYDDTKTIELVRRMMAENEGMSRRAAIIAVAGPDNLRRLEVKIAREDAAPDVPACPARDKFHEAWSDQGLERVDGRYKRHAGGPFFGVTEEGTGRDVRCQLPEWSPRLSEMMLEDHLLEIYLDDKGRAVAFWNRSTGKGLTPYPTSWNEMMLFMILGNGFVVALLVGLMGQWQWAGGAIALASVIAWFTVLRHMKPAPGATNTTAAARC